MIVSRARDAQRRNALQRGRLMRADPHARICCKIVPVPKIAITRLRLYAST